ncbi:MAG TPA: hypothetical protein VLJ58_15030 [Ramlibacter sp.]|nr:hypothetical protein [Ramlibacter sp.]
MHSPQLKMMQFAALAVALLRGMSEFASLQRWRLRDRIKPQA